MGRKLEKPGTIKPATPSAPAPKATAPAGGGGAAKPKAAGGTPRNPPPPPPKPEEPELVPAAQIALEPEEPELPPAPPVGPYGDEAQVAADRERRAKAMRVLAERRLPAPVKMLVSANTAVPSIASRLLVQGAKKTGLVDENTIEQFKKRAASVLPDFLTPKGVETVNPTGQRELVVRPKVRTPDLGRSLAEYQTTARQGEDALRQAQAQFDSDDADLREALANPAMPDTNIPMYERDMRRSLQRVADLRQSLRGMGYTEEEIKAIK